VLRRRIEALDAACRTGCSQLWPAGPAPPRGRMIPAWLQRVPSPRHPVGGPCLSTSGPYFTTQHKIQLTQPSASTPRDRGILATFLVNARRFSRSSLGSLSWLPPASFTRGPDLGHQGTVSTRACRSFLYSPFDSKKSKLLIVALWQSPSLTHGRIMAHPQLTCTLARHAGGTM
jgi:hypothetical protein